ncbi:MAG: glycosyltransferase family 2 protein [Bacteroidia bacterium]|nr:glycosyltransferase family 2 protein [Bacteroidia bacterium]MCF8426584.1 glycosyltransferase family 2 protein [Bacteroidia bacterium]MCF8446758.1 glycosyltransferase family 2 protein [Bacteroidia bacterium]
MQLSVVIVNYNVKYFLEQALHAVRKACNGIDAEVFVVDNHSFDGSNEMVRSLFPEVILIENKENVGFAKANNQAIRQSKGKYVLLLNPDTVIEEDCFKKVVHFMDQTPDAGAVGVKMIDGSGKFLPESKRGLPTPEVAFYKISGLAAIFPKSKKFGKYHLGFLSKDQINEVDVLAGAFMMLRHDVLKQVGLLDEDYFMYGEDIDLSYCINKAGFKNYYFPDTTIIHYKGESTKKTSVNFVFTFYKAMVIFAKKHYSQRHARNFSALIHIAIYLRAFAAIVSRFASKIFVPLLDFSVIFSSLALIVSFWSNLKYDTPKAYSPEIVYSNSIVYTLLWLCGLYLAGAYNKRKTFLSVVKGISFGTLAIAVFYAFIGEEYRFSRAIILLGAIAAVIDAYLLRVVLYFIKYRSWTFSMGSNLKTIIVGNKSEVERVQNLLIKSKSKSDYLGYVSVEPNKEDNHYLGQVNELGELVQFFGVEEIIFCSKDLAASQIIEWMGSNSQKDILYKIVPEESLFIIGSNNKNTPGDFYTIEINLKLSKAFELQKKRAFDVAASFLMLLFSPILLLFVKQRAHLFSNILEVLGGQKTWVGYANADNIKLLPSIRTGVVSPLDAEGGKLLNPVTIQKLNFLYAKDYSIEKDLLIVLKSIRSVGNHAA